MVRALILHITVLLVMSVNGDAQTITTIAGDGTMTNGPDGLAATSCGLYFPQAIVCDKYGNVFSEAGARLRKIDPAGIITTIAGTGVSGYTGDGGPATAAEIANVQGLAFDSSGNLYIANGLIRKITPSGIISTFAGSSAFGYGGDGGPASAAVFNRPLGIAFDDTGNLYVGDKDNHRVRKISMAGIVTTVAGTGIAGYSPDGTIAIEADIYQPQWLATDHRGNVYFSEGGNGVVRRINATTGLLETVAGNGPFPTPAGTLTGIGGPATAATYLVARGLALDDIGNIYISTSSGAGEYVMRIGADGLLMPYAGTGTSGFSGDGGPASAAVLKRPLGLHLDDTGNLYLSDQYNWRLRKVSTGNHLPSFTTGATSGFTTCQGVAVDISSALAVSDVDAGQPLSWMLFDAPAHGTASTTYTVAATGTVITPLGLSYTPAAGYAGADTFRVRIDDGISADFITVFINVTPTPDATIVAPADTICVGNSVTLSGVTAGGTWSTVSATASVSTSGIVTGISPGTAVIMHAVTNSCGTDVVYDTVTVVAAADCPVAVTSLSAINGGLTVWPIPATQYFNIRIEATAIQTADIEITDVIGRVVSSAHIPANTDMRLAAPGAAGTYLLRASSLSGVYYHRLVIAK